MGEDACEEGKCGEGRPEDGEDEELESVGEKKESFVLLEGIARRKEEIGEGRKRLVGGDLERADGDEGGEDGRT